MPAQPPQAGPWHSLSESASAPWVREGRGDTGRRRTAAGLGGRGRSRARLAGCSPGSARCVPCSPKAGSLRALVAAPSAPERECAGGDAGETLLFPLLLLGRSVRPPRRAAPRLAHWEV